MDSVIQHIEIPVELYNQLKEYADAHYNGDTGKFICELLKLRLLKDETMEV